MIILGSNSQIKTRNRFFARNRFFRNRFFTSIYFEGRGGQTLGQRGYITDHRPDLNQMVVGALINEQGRPIRCEMW